MTVAVIRLCGRWRIGRTGRPVRIRPSCAADVKPYFLRKVRILNAAHTAMASKAFTFGHSHRAEAMQNPEIAGWLEAMLFEETADAGRAGGRPEAARAADAGALRNPFLEQIKDILVYHLEKVQIQLAPRAEYAAVRQAAEAVGRGPGSGGRGGQVRRTSRQQATKFRLHLAVAFAGRFLQCRQVATVISHVDM